MEDFYRQKSGKDKERRDCFRQGPLPLGDGQGFPGDSIIRADREIPDLLVKITSWGRLNLQLH